MRFNSPDAAAVFAEYSARHRAEAREMDRFEPGELAGRRDEFLLPLGEDAGWLLHSLIAAREPVRILELGTSYGYSTLFLADAAAACGARLVTVDLVAEKQAYAAERIASAGLASTVEFRCGDAIEIVEADPGPFDFVLLDIWKDLYVPCFEAVYAKLSEEGIVATDNMIHPEGVRENARALREVIRSKPDMQTALLPVGQGIELSVRWSADNPNL